MWLKGGVLKGRTSFVELLSKKHEIYNSYKFIIYNHINLFWSAIYFNNAIWHSSGIIHKMWLNMQNVIILMLNTIIITCFLSSFSHKGSHNQSIPKFSMSSHVTLLFNSTLIKFTKNKPDEVHVHFNKQKGQMNSLSIEAVL